MTLNQAIDRRALQLVLDHRDRDADALLRRINRIHKSIDSSQCPDFVAQYVDEQCGRGKEYDSIEDALDDMEEALDQANRDLDAALDQS